MWSTTNGGWKPVGSEASGHAALAFTWQQRLSNRSMSYRGEAEIISASRLHSASEHALAFSRKGEADKYYLCPTPLLRGRWILGELSGANCLRSIVNVQGGDIIHTVLHPISAQQFSTFDYAAWLTQTLLREPHPPENGVNFQRTH